MMWRSFVFLLFACSVLFHSVVYTPFLSADLLSRTLLVCGVVLIAHIGLFRIAQNRWRGLVLASYLIDAFAIAYLLLELGLTKSLSLVVFVVFLLVVGYQEKSRVALVMAAIVAVLVTVLYAWGNEPLMFRDFLVLGLHYFAFFLTAWFSGSLAEQNQSLKQFQSTLLDQAPLPILQLDDQGQVTLANQLAQTWFIQGVLPATGLKDLIQSEGNARELKLGQGIEARVRCKAVSTPNDNSWLLVFEDITEINRTARQLKHQEKMAAIGGLAAGIAHEIRNPLAGISGSVELLLQNATEAEEKKLSRIILREIDRLNRLITEFLDYAKPDTAGAGLQKRKVDLVALTREVVTVLAQSEAAVTKVTLEFVGPDSFFVEVDPDRFRQVLFNIGTNAIQAFNSETEGQPSVRFVLTEQGNQWTMSIIDNGMGMSPALVEKMFEPFHTTKAKGTGLGLAITHKIINQHGGVIEVDSRLGFGTKIDLIFNK